MSMPQITVQAWSGKQAGLTVQISGPFSDKEMPSILAVIAAHLDAIKSAPPAPNEAEAEYASWAHVSGVDSSGEVKR
jgi:hypothetical protein